MKTPALELARSGHEQFIERCVIITRDSAGFGLTVSGDNPVFVQTVKEDGAAARVGILPGDRIIKVNGTPVTGVNHMEVVRLIACREHVALTLLSAPSFSLDYYNNNSSSASVTGLSLPQQQRSPRYESVSLVDLFHGNSAKIDSNNAVVAVAVPDEAVPEPRIVKQQNKTPPIPDKAPSSRSKETAAPANDNNGSQSNMSTASTLQYVAPGQVDVIPMDEDDSDSETVGPLEVHGPFGNFLDLKSHPAHLSVFLHYLISNSDPGSLLFYLITDYYQSATGAKDLRRWAYEIHSSFLVPMAPAKIASIDAETVNEIDSILCASAMTEQEDILKHLFVKARQKALEDINELLADFRGKRTLGLGSVYGENYLEELSTSVDRGAELRVVELLLLPHFNTLFASVSDFEQLSERSQVILACLATVLRYYGIKPPSAIVEKALDRCPCYVARDVKSKFKLRGVGGKKMAQIKGHHCVLIGIYTFTICYQCQEMVWGINPQAYQCSDCDMIVHKQCLVRVEETCYPTSKKKDPKKDWRVFGGTGRAKPSPLGGSAFRGDEVAQTDVSTVAASILEDNEDRNLLSEEDDQVGNLDLSCSPKERDWANKSSSASADSGYEENERFVTVQTPVSRTQSLRCRTDGRQSPFTIGARRAKTDIDVCENVINNIAMTESTLMSASTGSESDHAAALHDLAFSSFAPAGVAVKQAKLSEIATTDSDLDVDTEIPKIESLIDGEELKHLKAKDKKRQEVINELFHTERTHVRNLKVICRVFYNPLVTAHILPTDTIHMIFANIEEILAFHVKMNKAMKARNSQSSVVGNIGDLMLSFFHGSDAKTFGDAVAKFCRSQQDALEKLRERLKRDQKFAQFLQEAENNAICRKLQLKDMIPVEMQRLTKYPLLLENILKYTQEQTPELENVRTALDGAKQILAFVNAEKRLSENVKRLEELQRKLDLSAFEKVQHPIAQEFRKLDFRRSSLVHDGLLQWRLAKNKVVDLHVVLLEDLLVLLTRTNDNRLALRFHNTTVSVGKEDTKHMHCPLLKLNSVLPKNVATDKRAFFLVSTSAIGPQIYELVAPTTLEKKTWFKYIEDQVTFCKERSPPQQIGQNGNVCLSPPPPGKVLNGSQLEATIPPAPQIPVPLPPSTSSIPKSPPEEIHGDLRRSSIMDASQPPHLIKPSEVRVAQPTIYGHAEPVLTSIEKLRRKDEQIIGGLLDKQKILAHIYNVSVSELEAMSCTRTDTRSHRDAKELVLSSIVQGNRLLESINDSLRQKAAKDEASAANPMPELVQLPAPSVPCSRLTLIAAPLVRGLTQLLHSVEQQEAEVQRLQKELSRQKELLANSNSPRSHGGPPSHQSSLDHDHETAPPSSRKSSTSYGGGAAHLTRQPSLSKPEPAPTAGVRPVAHVAKPVAQSHSHATAQRGERHSTTSSAKGGHMAHGAPGDRQKSILDEIAQKLSLDRDSLSLPKDSRSPAPEQQHHHSPRPTPPAVSSPRKSSTSRKHSTGSSSGKDGSTTPRAHGAPGTTRTPVRRQGTAEKLDRDEPGGPAAMVAMATAIQPNVPLTVVGSVPELQPQAAATKPPFNVAVATTELVQPREAQVARVIPPISSKLCPFEAPAPPISGVVPKIPKTISLSAASAGQLSSKPSDLAMSASSSTPALAGQLLKSPDGAESDHDVSGAGGADQTPSFAERRSRQKRQRHNALTAEHTQSAAASTVKENGETPKPLIVDM